MFTYFTNSLQANGPVESRDNMWPYCWGQECRIDKSIRDVISPSIPSTVRRCATRTQPLPPPRHLPFPSAKDESFASDVCIHTRMEIAGSESGWVIDPGVSTLCPTPAAGLHNHHQPAYQRKWTCELWGLAQASQTCQPTPKLLPAVGNAC